MGFRQIFASQLTDVDTSPRDPVGSLRFEGDALYKYVKILNVSADVGGVAGDPIAYKASTGFATHTCVIDLSDADARPLGAGLLMGTVIGDNAQAEYGWIQLTGLGIVPTAVQGTPVIGSGVMMDTTDKRLTLVTGVINPVGTSVDTTGANNRIICQFPY